MIIRRMAMSPKEASTKEKILKCVVRLLFKSEPESITTRRIAQEAGVNVAAVNYHFRSKENLIDEAVLATSAAAFAQGMKLLKNKDIAPSERLRKFYEGYAAGLIEYKWITKTAFLNFLMSEHGSERYSAFMREILEETAGILSESSDTGPTRESTQKALLMFSGIALPFLVMGSLSGIGSIDFKDSEVRNSYIGLLVKTLKPQKGVGE
jgi:AcrR family transcriptional regulator